MLVDEEAILALILARGTDGGLPHLVIDTSGEAETMSMALGIPFKLHLSPMKHHLSPI